MNPYDITITRADALDCAVEPVDWRFARDREAEIARHWSGLVAERPRMFDGRVLLSHRDAIAREDGRAVLRAASFEVNFSAFVAWRDFGFPDPGVRNIFAMAALRGNDGGFVLAQMGEHTANAGLVYFPAGTPDPGDVRGDRLDLEGSVVRELAEETGLLAHEVRFAPDWLIVDAGPRLACMKIVDIDLPSREAAREIEGRIATQHDAELAGMRAVRNLAEAEAARPLDFVAAFLRRALDERPG